MKDFVFSLKVSRHTEPGNNGCGGIGEMKIVSGIVQMLDGIDDEFARSVVSLDFCQFAIWWWPSQTLSMKIGSCWENLVEEITSQNPLSPPSWPPINEERRRRTQFIPTPN